ncbi:MAG: hypothetical protein QOK35_2734, partial [Pseudonocardiales bacterium]|nr:hypothetical protein [Pseudonocardiales bacterium]
LDLDLDLDTVADELYALPPDAFIPARDDRVAAAKESGDRDLARAIARLRRPTRAAWLANLLARHRTEQLDGLVALSRSLAQAQQELDGDALRTLSGQRHRAVAAMARDAGRLAARQGEPVNDALLREVAGILDAALADPSVADDVRAGRLTKTVRYSGFGPAGGSADGTDGDPDDMSAWAASAPARPARTRGAPAPGSDDTATEVPDEPAEPDTGTGDRGGERERAEQVRRERAERERVERERAAALRAEREQALADAEAQEVVARERQESDEAERDRADGRHATARSQVAELAAALDAARGEEQAALEASREAATAARASARDAAAAAVRTARARTRLEQLPPAP